MSQSHPHLINKNRCSLGSEYQSDPSQQTKTDSNHYTPKVSNETITACMISIECKKKKLMCMMMGS